MTKQKNTGASASIKRGVPVAKVSNADNTATKAVKAPSSLQQWGIVAGICALIYFVYQQSLGNQFTNWDDPGYVVNNPLIKSLSGENIAAMFGLDHPIMGNYHPITMLTYAIDYSRSALDPYSFHLQSLLFHLATTVMVYLFTLKLTGARMAAIVAALLFGLHPMHVESVAWVAGRKDVVYGVFFMGACITYLHYIRQEKTNYFYYVATLVLFICSLLSKPVAVSLPITLLLIDFIEPRKVKFNMWLEKVPFLALSILAGIKSIQDQRVFGALATQSETYTFFERIGLGGYAFITYLWKLLLPIKLLCFYPYPLKVDGHMKYEYYLYPLLSAILLWVVWRFFKQYKMVLFGVAFFIVNIALLLQFLPVGGAIIADRYTYIPYVGLCILIGWLTADKGLAIYKKVPQTVAYVAVGAFIMVCAFLSQKRSLVWYDAMSLWRDEIEVEPVRVPSAYNNLGFTYFSMFNSAVELEKRKLYYDSSNYLLRQAIYLQPKFVNPYISLGELQRANGQFEEAKANYFTAIKLDETGEQIANAFLGLAIVYSIKTMDNPANKDTAVYYYYKTLEKKPYYPEAHSNLANLYDMTGLKDSALQHYGKAIEQNPDISAPYLNRGRALERMGRLAEAVQDLDMAISRDPELGEIYYARAICYQKMGKKDLAQADVQKAKSLGFNRQ